MVGPPGLSAWSLCGQRPGEVACPQELGGLAHALTRAGSPTTLWGKLRTPPAWGSFLANVQSWRGWNLLLNSKALSSSPALEPGCQGSRPHLPAGLWLRLRHQAGGNERTSEGWK